MEGASMRRRAPQGQINTEAMAPPPPRKSLANAVKALDMYSNNKLATEYTVAATATASERKMTSVGIVVMVLLLISEFMSFVRLEERDHLTVDKTLGDKLRIALNVSFPALTCAEVHLDAMDVAGDYHPYMEHHMTKRRLSAAGWPIEGGSLNEKANEFEHGPGDAVALGCGSCFGAETPETPCCETCDALIQAYGTKGWSTNSILATAPQCSDQRPRGGALSLIQKGEGCNLAGWLEVNKVGGNFHVALGESAVNQGRFIHQFNPTDAPKFNVSHIIHEISFGAPYPGMVLPLNGESRFVDAESGTGLYQYFIKLVPTVYAERAGAEPFRTMRYSYTHRFRPLKAPHPLDEEMRDHHAHAHENSPTAILPGVFWVYDLSAFMVEVTRERPTFAHFLVRVCAIVGGVFTLLGALDWVYQNFLQC